jgi:hypothetical protein
MGRRVRSLGGSCSVEEVYAMKESYFQYQRFDMQLFPWMCFTQLKLIVDKLRD